MRNVGITQPRVHQIGPNPARPKRSSRRSSFSARAAPPTHCGSTDGCYRAPQSGRSAARAGSWNLGSS